MKKRPLWFLGEVLYFLRARCPKSAFLYGLIAVPFGTDFVESGHFPRELREWTTEIVMTVVLAGIVSLVQRQYSLLERRSLVDHLTGIGNRTSFDADLEREVERAERQGQRIALAFFDLDGFKGINDRLGHAAGDRLLRDFAACLRSATRKGADSCYRFGGDEFAVLLTGVEEAEESALEERLEREFARIAAAALPEGVSASRGAVILEEGEGAEAFLARADSAMYEAKRRRKGGKR